MLQTGWVEGEQIRCMYHGWRYDGAGQCTQMPAEKRPRPELVKSPPIRCMNMAG